MAKSASIEILAKSAPVNSISSPSIFTNISAVFVKVAAASASFQNHENNQIIPSPFLTLIRLA